MSFPNLDAKTLGAVAAVATRLQAAREASRLAGRGGRVTAEEMETIGREVGLSPALMRQALGMVLAHEAAERKTRRQTRWALGAAAALLVSGLAAGYGFGGDRDTTSPVRRASAVPASAVLPDRPVRPAPVIERRNDAGPEDEREVRHLTEIENIALNNRDLATLKTLYSQGYSVMQAGVAHSSVPIRQMLDWLSAQPSTWHREVYIVRSEPYVNSVRVLQYVTYRSVDERGQPASTRRQLLSTWVREGQGWVKMRDEEGAADAR